MFYSKKKMEKGQIIVIFVLALFAMVAIGALLIDGGQTYMNRRSAQVAADAGALAGAHEFCQGSTTNVIQASALQYAQSENYSSTAQVTIGSTKQDGVTVDVTIAQPTFLAQLFGRDNITVEASATAGCYFPGAANHVLPVAWSCKGPVGTTTSLSDCKKAGLDYANQFLPLTTGKDVNGNTVTSVTINGVVYPAPYTKFGEGGAIIDKKLYIIMDSETATSDHCKPPLGTGTIDCDWDGDGAMDMMVGNGDRSWLDLDHDNLSKSIQNYATNAFGIHTWVQGQTGNVTSVYMTVEDLLVNTVVMVPIFNDFCDKKSDIFSPACQNKVHNGPTGVPLEPGETDSPIIEGEGKGSIYYHIVGFAPFYVSCVDLGGKNPAKECPGHNKARLSGLKFNANTIEGYFIDGYPMDFVTGSGGVDLGIKIISLTK